MALTSLGSLSVGQALPTLQAANLALSANISAQAPRVNAQLAAAFTATPPALATDLITNLQAMIAALGALLASGIAVLPPAISASLTAELLVSKGALDAALAIVAELSGYLSAPGVYMYTYEGRDTDLPGAINAAIGGGLPGGPETFGLLLLTTTAGTGAALKSIAGVT